MRAEARAVTPSAEFDCATCGARLDLLHVDVAAGRMVCSFCGTPQEEVEVAGMPPSQPSLDVGQTLRFGREVRGETLEQASRFTRIRLSYLRDLEGGDPHAFDPYPGRVYARFFLREYAVHLGLEPQPLLRRFDASADPVVVPLPPRPKPIGPPHHRRWAMSATITLAAALTLGALASRGDDAPMLAPGMVGAARGVAIDMSPQGPPAPRPAVAGSSAPLTASVATRRDCWILAVADGEVVFQETVPAGETIELVARRALDLRLGDAGAVRLVVNGRKVPTGRGGAVADLSFTVRNGRLIGR